ncbi:Regulation of longevity by E3 ubiquitin-protein ligase [Frankliniella fusca]|uniref:Regulation of longevity by E3 ubiquitin-protein ligase n=1 Tax=Frankliniella fusca TaxID=407009 RepID=A0AAE1HFK3_9NEOP|nr:Regulation of longevity by E3 ubiquitin-protein ligase [Frankliniella fusca]
MPLPCDICFEHFDSKVHRPKSLPCGHTFCLKCLHNPSLGKICPSCRKRFTTGPVDLPDNVYLMSVMETVDQTVASPGDLQQLQRGVDAAEHEVRLLEQAMDALHIKLTSSRTQLQQLKKAVQARAPTVGQLKLAAQLEDRHRLLTASKHALIVEDKDGATRRFSLEPDHHLACLMPLLQGAREEDNKDDKEDTEDDLACCPLGPPSFSNDTPILSYGARNRCITYKGQEEMRLSEVTSSYAREVGDMSLLKRLYIFTYSVVGSNPLWPDLPLQLEELHIVNAHAAHLRCLQRMPRLRSLAVNGYVGAALTLDPLKPCSRCGVQWLGVRMKEDQYSTLLSLVRACAASLRVLEIKCGLKDFPALSKDLQASGLRFLRRLVLVREHPAGDTKDCDRQRLAIQGGLPKALVVCSKCYKDFQAKTW